MARALLESELLSLVDALSAGEWCSGEALAAEAGVTRAALAKRMDHLREWGLFIQTQAGRGYRLAYPIERLDADGLRQAIEPVTASCLRNLKVLTHTDSTNQRLLESDASCDPQVVFAERQTAGRGRRGRSWCSPFASNLYFSLGWTFPSWPPQLGTASLVVGIACARALQGRGLHAVRLKWPNDLRVGAAKLGGILIEQRGEAGGPCRLVIGIGINCAMQPEQGQSLDQPWTTVAEVLQRQGQPPLSRGVLAACLLDALVAALTKFESCGFQPFLQDWNRLDAAADQPVRVLGVEPPITGIARGIDANGALIVEADGRRHHLHAGEVSLRLEEGKA